MSTSSQVHSSETTSVREMLAVLRLHGVQARYGNFIGGSWVAPIKENYFVDKTPPRKPVILGNDDGRPSLARSTQENPGLHQDRQGRGSQGVIGGERARLGDELENGYYVKPTVFAGHNKMRIFQEEIFGPVLSVTKFSTLEEAIAIGNDTVYGLGAGVWTRNAGTAYRVGRELQAGRVWTNCYHLYPAHAAFGGYKQSGFGRKTHKMILDHYQQTKNLLVSYSPSALGLF